MSDVPAPTIIPPPHDAAEPPRSRRSRMAATIRAVMRARITAGLIVVLPLWITFLLVKFIFELMRDMSLWAVHAYLSSGWGAPLLERLGVSSQQVASEGIHVLPTGLQWAIGIFSVFLTIFFLYVIGVMTANIVGRRVVKGLERLLERVPIIKTIYGASKQILETFAGESAQNFQRVALVPYPSKECRSIGFITGFSRDAHTGEELCSVFVATTPTTTGYVFLLKRSDVIEVNWSIEDAIRLIISGGVLMPGEIPFTTGDRKAPAAIPPARNRPSTALPAEPVKSNY